MNPVLDDLLSCCTSDLAHIYKGSMPAKDTLNCEAIIRQDGQVLLSMKKYRHLHYLIPRTPQRPSWVGYAFQPHWYRHKVDA